jgi:hypothetical protein
MKKIGKINIAFGWCWLFVGIVMAMLMGMYAFNADWLGGYTSLPRRFLRLSHISFMALSLANVIYGLSLESANLTDKLKKIGSYLMIVAAVFMPLICLLSIYRSLFRAFFCIPALSFAAAVFIMAMGQLKRSDQ